ncbi:MAG: hypothetical protein GXY68_02815 [Chloroflexi bacterium]|nr:hypothetical protein [Chloroflexota bacterium]
MAARTSQGDAKLRALLADAKSSDAAGQAALDRLYRHYDPLIRASLPKGLPPDDAEDLVMDAWAAVVTALRQGRGLRDHKDVVALIAAHLRRARRPLVDAAPARRPSLWARVWRLVRLLLPPEGE